MRIWWTARKKIEWPLTESVSRSHAKDSSYVTKPALVLFFGKGAHEFGISQITRGAISYPLFLSLSRGGMEFRCFCIVLGGRSWLRICLFHEYKKWKWNKKEGIFLHILLLLSLQDVKWRITKKDFCPKGGLFLVSFHNYVINFLLRASVKTAFPWRQHRTKLEH